MMSRHRPPPRRHTPRTFVGGVLLPFLAACVMAYFIAKRFFPDAFAELLRRAFASRPAVHAFALAEAAREAAVRLTRTRTRTRTRTPNPNPNPTSAGARGLLQCGGREVAIARLAQGRQLARPEPRPLRGPQGKPKRVGRRLPLTGQVRHGG